MAKNKPAVPYSQLKNLKLHRNRCDICRRSGLNDVFPVIRYRLKDGTVVTACPSHPVDGEEIEQL